MHGALLLGELVGFTIEANWRRARLQTYARELSQTKAHAAGEMAPPVKQPANDGTASDAAGETAGDTADRRRSSVEIEQTIERALRKKGRRTERRFVDSV